MRDTTYKVALSDDRVIALNSIKGGFATRDVDIGRSDSKSLINTINGPNLCTVEWFLRQL